MKRYCFAFLFLFAACATERSVSEDCIDASKIAPDAMCTMEYMPVCGCNQVTYGNKCEATKAGVTSWKEGKCK